MAKEGISQGISHNALAQGTFVKGELRAEEDIRIDGIIEGDVRCKGKVVIGAKGEVRGHIVCENAEFMGRVEGDVVVNGHISFKQMAIFQGNLTTKTLNIEPGALFNGTCKMGDGGAAAAAAKKK